MLGRRLGGAAVALVLALCALLPSVALGGDEGEVGASTLFSVKASHGYQMIVFGDSDREDGRGEVGIYLLGKGRERLAYYLTKGIVTDTSLMASFGALGRIDLDLRLSGKEGKVRAPAPCNGSTEDYEKTTYRGTFRFRGEEGFATARASRIAVSPQAWINLVCSNYFEVESEELEPGTLGASLHAALNRRNRTRIEFEVTKNRSDARALVSASVTEKRHGIMIGRSVAFLADATSFDYDSPLSTASVELPAPFSGSAVYRRDARPAKRWVGNLSVDLPGRANVSLVRPDLGTTLLPAVWSVEPPEFR